MSEFPGPQLVFSRQSRFTSKPFEDLRASGRPWRVKHAMPMRGVAFIVGASGARKTFFSLDGLLKLASGSPTVWGRKAKPCGVAYIAAEDPDGCEARSDAWKRERAAHRTTPVPFELVPQAPKLLDDEDLGDLKAHLRDMAERFEAMGSELGVVAFDTLSACIPGVDENSSADMSRAMDALHSLAGDLDVLVVVVAHFGKSGSERGIRGWSGLGANADGVIGLELDEADPLATNVTFNKVKNGPAGARLAFSLQDVDLGLDDDGDVITSCVVKFHEPPPKAEGRRQKPVESKPGPKIVLRAFYQLKEVGPTFVVPPLPGVPPGTSGVERTALRARAESLGHPSNGLKTETVKRMINKDISELIAAGKLREEDGIIWSVK